jgi:YjbE family integral membrane protein
VTFASPEFWIALMQIIGVNIVLSGDNAVVIALAARGLPPHQQKQAVAWGSGAAVVMRILLTIVAVELLKLPYLKLVGAGLLLWIAVQLLLPEDEGHGESGGVSSMAAAIKTILLADLVMSLDNVIAVAAAAKGNLTLLIIGLAISIPLVVFASRLLLTLMDRFPIIITLGAALLGWVAGDMAVSDPIDKAWVDQNMPFLHYVVPALCAIGVVLVGRWLAARAEAGRGHAPAANGQVAAGAAAPAVASTTPGRFQRVLLAVDGSPAAERAVRHLIELRQALRHPELDLHLVNVQRPMSGDVSRFVAGDTLDDYHRERSEQALAPARALLGAAGMPSKEHVLLGQPGPTIARIAHDEACDLIVMGTRGLGSHTGVILGSVAQETLENASVPVLMVK